MKKAKHEHAKYCNLENFYFDDIMGLRFFSVLKTHIGCVPGSEIFENWLMDNIFLSLAVRKKSSNFIHMLYSV